MTRHDFFIKWLVHGVALLPIWFLETMVLNRFPVFGVSPMLLPLAAIAVAVLEGGAAGGGFGLAVGILCDAVYFSTSGTMTIGLTLLGILSGIVAQYALRQNFVGCLLCSAGALTLLDALRMAARLFRGAATLPSMLEVAIPEVLWSLVFVWPIYLLFRWVYQRTGGSTLF